MGLREKILGKQSQPKKAEVAKPKKEKPQPKPQPKPKRDPDQLLVGEIEIILKLLNETTFKGKDIATIWSIMSKLNNQINKII